MTQLAYRRMVPNQQKSPTGLTVSRKFETCQSYTYLTGVNKYAIKGSLKDYLPDLTNKKEQGMPGTHDGWPSLKREVTGKRVALIRCADPRVNASERKPGGLYHFLLDLSAGAGVYEIVAEGAAWQFSPSHGLTDAAVQINQHVLHTADVIVVFAHGDCAKYGGDDDAALQDNKVAVGFLQEWTDKPVFLVWQPDPTTRNYEVR